MPERPEELVRRALKSADSHGRLGMPQVHEWETFPFDGDIRVRPFRSDIADEEPRHGEGGVDCWQCDHGKERAIWSDTNWMLDSLNEPSGLPVVVVLYPREHHDIDDLGDDLAAQLGPLLVRVEAAVRSVGGIGRVHISRWGDGSAHLHFWFQARPAGVPRSEAASQPSGTTSFPRSRDRSGGTTSPWWPGRWPPQAVRLTSDALPNSNKAAVNCCLGSSRPAGEPP